MGGLGSLASCPGLKTAASAAVGYSRYGKSLHGLHLPFIFRRIPGYQIGIFFNFPLMAGEIV